MAKAPTASDAAGVPVRGSAAPPGFTRAEAASTGAAMARLVSLADTAVAGAASGGVTAGVWPVPDEAAAVKAATGKSASTGAAGVMSTT